LFPPDSGDFADFAFIFSGDDFDDIPSEDGPFYEGDLWFFTGLGLEDCE
jgi:hypothetical protein